MSGTFAGQIAVVTGASSGVGRAIALRLAAQEATVCLLGRRLDALREVAEAILRGAGGAIVIPVDLTNDEERERAQERLLRSVEQVDMLVHSAGVIGFGAVESALLADFDYQYRLNVRAPYALTQALLPPLMQQQGQIAFINSSTGLTARGGGAQYAATKHALKALADSLRDEVNAPGVRVLSIYLGRTATPMQATVHAREGKAFAPERLIQPEDVAATLIHAFGLPRTVEITDLTMRPMLKPR